MDRLDGRTTGVARRIVRVTVASLALIGCAMIVAPPFARAAGNGAPDTSLLGALKGNELHGAALGRLRAGGVVIQNATTDGSVSGSVGRGAVTGTVSASNAINNNAGITTVFQNSGNNALIQNTMTINVTMH
ncbi:MULTISPECIES: hypothetical protein [Acidiphilium]|jgi:hypothetical protein|uniref:Uncharacterized protein n=2 Tax=Acidiphilium TaxID=522 RepID=A5G1P4_ACICJ|nr:MULTISPECIES: hypothetical protein [Acidiphilium]MBU6357034.1 hypothetical protein [Rhodospirillales bacterium]ABQ31776.1 hypothetical protein Acry_2585 [Acidiphilium cryptum JF-5]EGO95691.1 hypothetical protein APM_1475 [Acidiphilium sp. PM]MBS3023059.1 hypothetical protein [Acidiphilium multivorum]MDE2327421.1 hypothetical protein [Rhodospirillales bacterium]